MSDPVKIEIPAELDRELDALSVQSGREKWLLATQALSTFLDNKLNNQSSLDMFKTMHDVAGKYHCTTVQCVRPQPASCSRLAYWLALRCWLLAHMVVYACQFGY
jgi:hypothetical protein